MSAADPRSVILTTPQRTGAPLDLALPRDATAAGIHIDPGAGQPLPAAERLNVSALIAAYFSQRPDLTVAAQQVRFGTSGHRGSAFNTTFNEWHVLAITQAICDERRARGCNGPLFLGADTHALSAPASISVREVLAANEVSTRIAPAHAFTPTPAVSFAILRHNRQYAGQGGLADGILLTPSHNPPAYGGLKYNPAHGGGADSHTTQRIETAANGYLRGNLAGVRRVSLAHPRCQPFTRQHDFCQPYVRALGDVVALDRVRSDGIRIGVDPLGGAGVAYWPAIAEHWRLDLTVTDATVDPTFAQIRRDGDGQVRMDPSSPWVMGSLVQRRQEFDVAFACDTDHDRHGIVTPDVGLLAPNHYLAVITDFLLRHRPSWSARMAVGKTMVCTRMIDRVAAALDRTVWTVPVGFKWFAAGLHDGRLGVCGEESAGASFLATDGRPWSTDKDGMIAGLLAAEITAVNGANPAQAYAVLTARHGELFGGRRDLPASRAQRQQLAALPAGHGPLAPGGVLAGDTILQSLTHAPGNGAPFGGLQVCTRHGWIALRPSGTEDLYKIYGESGLSQTHLALLLDEAQQHAHDTFSQAAAVNAG